MAAFVKMLRTACDGWCLVCRVICPHCRKRHDYPAERDVPAKLRCRKCRRTIHVEKH